MLGLNLSSFVSQISEDGSSFHAFYLVPHLRAVVPFKKYSLFFTAWGIVLRQHILSVISVVERYSNSSCCHTGSHSNAVVPTPGVMESQIHNYCLPKSSFISTPSIRLALQEAHTALLFKDGNQLPTSVLTRQGACPLSWNKVWMPHWGMVLGRGNMSKESHVASEPLSEYHCCREIHNFLQPSKQKLI